MSIESDNLGHGHSPAAWVAVTIMLVAFTAGAIFFWLDLPVLVVISAIVMFAGWALGGVLSKMGYGVRGSKYQAKGH